MKKGRVAWNKAKHICIQKNFNLDKVFFSPLIFCVVPIITKKKVIAQLEFVDTVMGFTLITVTKWLQ